MQRTVQTIVQHIRTVQDALNTISDELRRRAFAHDSSKFQSDEFEGYTRFELMPKGLEYGSKEYQDAMKVIMTDNDCFTLHAQRNDHHPEHFSDVQKMNFIQIQEMVCDWAGDHMRNSNTGAWTESVLFNMRKHNFSEGQQWLIRQVAEHLKMHILVLQENDTPWPKNSVVTGESNETPE